MIVVIKLTVSLRATQKFRKVNGKANRGMKKQDALNPTISDVHKRVYVRPDQRNAMNSYRVPL